MKVYAEYVDFTYPNYIGFPSEGADIVGVGCGFTVEEALQSVLEMMYQGMDNPDELDWESIEQECREQLSEELEYPDAYEFARKLGFNLDDDDMWPQHYVGVRVWL